MKSVNYFLLFSIWMNLWGANIGKSTLNPDAYLSSNQIVTALALVANGVSVDSLVKEIGPPEDYGFDIPFFGPTYRINGGILIFSLCKPTESGLIYNENNMIGSVIFCAEIGEVRMPSTYVLPLEFRGQEAKPPGLGLIRGEKAEPTAGTDKGAER